MKIKSGFILREIAGQWVVVPLGPRVVEFNNIMTLTESGAFLWNMLEQGATADEMVNAMLSEYDAEETVVRRDVKAFTDSVFNAGLFE